VLHSGKLLAAAGLASPAPHCTNHEGMDPTPPLIAQPAHSHSTDPSGTGIESQVLRL